MTNIRVSPLLLFVQSELKYRRKQNNNAILAKAKSGIDNRLTNCCLYQESPANIPYLNIFYNLMNSMDTVEDLPKLQVVQTLLGDTINCCD